MTTKPIATTEKTQGKATIADLQRLYEGLSPEDRDKLARTGVTIPEGDISAIATGKYKWGLRCTKCNKVALYFVGTKWTQGGVEHDVPPTLPHNEIAWTQMLPPSDIDRNQPRCQCCGVVLPLLQSGAFDYGNVLLNGAQAGSRSRLVQVVEFEASRDAAFDRRNIEKHRRERDRGAGQTDQHGISFDYNAKPVKASEIMNQKFGDGTAEAVQKVAEETGAANYIPSR